MITYIDIEHHTSHYIDIEHHTSHYIDIEHHTSITTFIAPSHIIQTHTSITEEKIFQSAQSDFLSGKLKKIQGNYM